MAEKLVIQVKDEGINTVMPNDEDDTRYLTVENQEQKEYAEYLRDKMNFGITTIHTYLGAMKRYKEFKGDGL